MPSFKPEIVEFKQFIPVPQYLLDNPNLNSTEKLVYIELLKRTRLSQMNAHQIGESNKWENENGEIFIFYPIKDLAKKMKRGESAIKTALKSLEQEGLLRRERQGQGQANRLYLQYPEGECFTKGEKPPVKKGENSSKHGQKNDCQGGGKPTGNNNNSNYIYKNKGDSYNGRKSGAGFGGDSQNETCFKSERWGRVF